MALTVEHNGFYGTYGTFGDDFDGDYTSWAGERRLRLGYRRLSNFQYDDLSDELDDDGEPTEGEAVIFTIRKTF